MPRLVLDEPRKLVLDEPKKPRLVLDKPRKLKLVEEKPLSGLAQKISPILGEIVSKGKKAISAPQKIIPDYLAGEREKREVIKEFISAKPERPYAVNIAGEFAKPFVDYASPEMVIAGGLTGGVAKIGIGKALATKTGLKLAKKYLPTLLKQPIAQVKDVRLPKPKVEVKPLDPVQKVTQALKEAKPIRKGQEALYTAERAKRVAQLKRAGEVGGEAGYIKQLKALKGQLPKAKFEGIRGKIEQTDVDSLFNIIEKNTELLPLEKITTKAGLAKLLGAEGGAVPTKGELTLLGQVFPKDFVNTILTKRTLGEKVGEGIADVLNIPRALMASGDLSAPLRQGVFLVGRPKQFFPAFRDMFKYFFSEKAYQGLSESIKKKVTYPLMKKSKLPLTDVGKGLTGREEAFMSGLAEKIPLGVGKIVRASDRAYTGFLNKLRADVFEDLVKSAQKQGIKTEGKVLTDISRFVGAATGRGNLGALENSAVALNTVFFSPRLMASRLNLLNPAFYVKLDPFARKEALKSLLTFAGTATSVFSLAKMGGAEIGVDPRNADFGKIKVGNTRYDILGGFQQYIRAAAQLITGEHISSTTGVKSTVGEGYKPLTRMQIISRFFTTKESPVASFVTAMLRGKTAIGKDIVLKEEVANRFTPMVAQDMKDLYDEKGLEGILMGTPAIFGVGLQTYAPTPSELVYSANSVLKNARELSQQGRFEEARELMEKNRDIIEQGKEVEPMQKVINFFKKINNKLKKSTFFTPEQIKEKTAINNEKIKQIEKEMKSKLDVRQ